MRRRIEYVENPRLVPLLTRLTIARQNSADGTSHGYKTFFLDSSEGAGLQPGSRICNIYCISLIVSLRWCCENTMSGQAPEPFSIGAPDPSLSSGEGCRKHHNSFAGAKSN